MSDAKPQQILWTVLRNDESSVAPERPHANDAGFDLTVSRNVTIEPGAFAAIPTNIAIALPDHVWALLVGRSSTFYRRALLVNMGVIDPGYRGEIMGLVHNLGDEKIVVRQGERLFQIIPVNQLTAPTWKRVLRGKDLPVSHRGAAGVGSTGGYITTRLDPEKEPQAQ